VTTWRGLFEGGAFDDELESNAVDGQTRKAARNL
jgi:hypothetical protein